MRMDLDQRIPSLMEVREKVNEMEQKVIIKESIADFKQYGLKGATAAILAEFMSLVKNDGSMFQMT